MNRLSYQKISFARLLILPFLLAACNIMLSRQPPGVELVAGDQIIQGVQGTSTWGGRAVEHLITIPPESASVTPAEQVKFKSSGNRPSEVFLSAYRARDVTRLQFEPIWEGELDPDNMLWKVNLQPGEYVLVLFRAWPTVGDTTHHFSVNVHGREQQ